MDRKPTYTYIHAFIHAHVYGCELVLACLYMPVLPHFVKVKSARFCKESDRQLKKKAKKYGNFYGYAFSSNSSEIKHKIYM